MRPGIRIQTSKAFGMRVEQPFKLLPHTRVAAGPQVMIDTHTPPPPAHKDSLNRRSSMSSPESAHVQPELARVGSRESHRSASPPNSASPGSRATPGSRSNSTPSANINSSGLPPRGLASPDAILRPLAEIRTTNSINLQLPPTCGAKQLAKLKRFLTTLQQFGSDISAEIGERVRSLVLALVNNQLTIEDFHAKLQETTNFPLKPFVIPFLKATLPSLQSELRQCAQITQQSPQQYLASHERILFDSSSHDLSKNNNNLPSSLSPEFREKGPTTPNKRKISTDESPDLLPSVPKKILRDGTPPSTTRTSPPSRTSINSDNGLLAPADRVLGNAKDLLAAPSVIKLEDISRHSRARLENSDFLSAAGLSLPGSAKSLSHTSPPSERLPLHHGNGSSPTGQPGSGGSGIDKEEDNWRRVDNLLLNMAGLLEKTKTAMSALQESRVKEAQEFSLWMRRHAEGVDQDVKKRTGEMMTHTLKKSEDRIAEVKRRADEMVVEVKRQAILEIHQAITAAEVRANELVSQERVRMENVLNHIKKTAKDEAVRGLNKQSDSAENCWNCGRRASETCSGCNKARYCGQFCQHKDWDKHHTSCGINTTPTNPAETVTKDNTDKTDSPANDDNSNNNTKPKESDSKEKTTSIEVTEKPTKESTNT